MRKSLKVSRGLQLVGAVLIVAGIVSCANQGDPRSMSQMFMAGGLLVIGARIFEWLSKE